MYNWKLPEVNSSLKGCKTFKWKSDVFSSKWKKDAFNMTLKKYFFLCKSDALENLLNRNLTRIEFFNSNLCFLRKHQKCKICRFRGVKRTKTWFFGCQHFFKTWNVQNFIIQNLTRCIFFQSKIWRFVKMFNQNLTGFEIFIPKSDALEKLNSKSDKVKIFFPKPDFYLVFVVLTEWWYFLSTLITTWFKEEK